uniref:Uncharacterized protein n=1 Tax=Arundo donax TaxID=35708 RepID=A0A0A9ELH2_ARUDO
MGRTTPRYIARQRMARARCLMFLSG